MHYQKLLRLVWFIDECVPSIMSVLSNDNAGAPLNQTALDHFNELVEHGQFPAANPPPGVTSNLIDPEWRGWLAYMTAVLSLPV